MDPISEAKELRRVRNDPRFRAGIFEGAVRAVPDWSRGVWVLGDRDRLTHFVDVFFARTNLPTKWRDGSIDDSELEAVAECLSAVYRSDAEEAANE